MGENTPAPSSETASVRASLRARFRSVDPLVSCPGNPPSRPLGGNPVLPLRSSSVLLGRSGPFACRSTLESVCQYQQHICCDFGKNRIESVTKWERTNISMVPSAPLHEHETSGRSLGPLILFVRVLFSSSYRSRAYSVRFIRKYLILGGSDVSGIVFLISNSTCLLLVGRKPIDGWILTLYPAILL